MLSLLRRIVHGLLDPPARIPDLDPDDTACNAIALDLAAMGRDAASRDGRPSPGTERLLPRARLLGQRRFAQLVPPLSHGIASSSASRLAIGAADEQVAHATANERHAQDRLERHNRNEPRRPPIVNRTSAHPLTRTLIATLCTLIELLITAPALVILTHGRRLLDLVSLEDALAALLGLMTFAAAEVAAECLLTWRLGRPTERRALAARMLAAMRRLPARLTRRRPASPRPWSATGRPTTRDARAALVAGVVIVVAMVGALGWLVAVRDANIRAASEIAAGGVTSTRTGLGGLPGAPSAAGPISGLGGGPIALGSQPPSTRAQPEGQLGPLGALSIVVFVVALASATLAGTTSEHAEWARKRRALRREHRDAHKRRLAAEHTRSATATRAPLGSVVYDTAARHAVTVADAYLQLAAAWEGLVRQHYLVHCRRAGQAPEELSFPPLPALPDEVERLLTPAVPDGRQAGGYAFGTHPPVDPVPNTDPEGRPSAGPTTPPVAAAGSTAAPARASDDGEEGQPTRGPADHPDPDAVLDAVADLAARLRGLPEQPAPEPHRGRFVRGLRRRARRRAGGRALDPDPAP